MHNYSIDKLQEQAIGLIHQACNPDGIYASPIDQDNYKRVWSRDSILAGIAGLLVQDEVIIDHLKRSLQTLSKHQLLKGTIPSNVQSIPKDHISYGSLVGRVDATSLYIVGVCLYTLNQKDEDFFEEEEPSIAAAETVLDSWEFNNKHLIYTPLSGNWADEYVMHGYLLYDNCLRLWALKLLQQIKPTVKRDEKVISVQTAIETNFWPHKKENYYHPRLVDRLSKHSPFYLPGFNPSRYYPQFDASGNGLALLLLADSDNQSKEIEGYLDHLESELNTLLIPAFWPPIKQGDPLWADLEMNYDFSFKNEPHAFHNGGIWPIMMGVFCLGLSKYTDPQKIKEILEDYLSIENIDHLSFSEYIRSDNLALSGKKPLCFSATGLIFMIAALDKKNLDRLFIN